MTFLQAALPSALLAATGLFVSGCMTERALAKRIVRAPNQQGVPRTLKQAATFGAQYLPHWRVPVGPPTAELAVAVVEPRDYHLRFELKEMPDPKNPEGHVMSVDFHFDLTPPPGETPAPVTPKGTLVLLHGIMMNKESMLMPWGLYFAEKGYRVVIVDLRGHGGSTGNWIGYGAWEAADLRKVADDLQRRGLMTDRIGVFGISYGATMALQWAAQDQRVAAIVALAPFSDARRAIVEFARGVMPKLATKISDAQFAAAEERAAGLAGFAWSDTDLHGAMQKIHAPVLFYHGQVDDWVSPQHSAELMQLAPTGSRRRLLPDNHLSLTFRFEPIGAQALAWFDAHVAAARIETVAGN